MWTALGPAGGKRRVEKPLIVRLLGLHSAVWVVMKLNGPKEAVVSGPFSINGLNNGPGLKAWNF